MRRTIGRPVSLGGIGLHGGEHSTVTLEAAAPGHGIVFVRSDISTAPRIPAHVNSVTGVDRRTVIGIDGVTVDTTEHLMAAVAGCEVDDLLVTLDGPEVPILDGSAAPFVRALQEAGFTGTNGEAECWVISEPLSVKEGDAVYHIEPAAEYRVTVEIHWSHPLIGVQRVSAIVEPPTFAVVIAPARTFGRLDEIGALRARGLVRGATMDCGVALTENGVANGPLRWPDEFARHKLLDLVGDLALLGGRLRGHISARRPSHRGNCAVARAIHRHVLGE